MSQEPHPGAVKPSVLYFFIIAVFVLTSGIFIFPLILPWKESLDNYKKQVESFEMLYYGNPDCVMNYFAERMSLPHLEIEIKKFIAFLSGAEGLDIHSYEKLVIKKDEVKNSLKDLSISVNILDLEFGPAQVKMTILREAFLKKISVSESIKKYKMVAVVIDDPAESDPPLMYYFNKKYSPRVGYYDKTLQAMVPAYQYLFSVGLI